MNRVSVFLGLLYIITSTSIIVYLVSDRGLEINLFLIGAIIVLGGLFVKFISDLFIKSRTRR